MKIGFRRIDLGIEFSSPPASTKEKIRIDFIVHSARLLAF